MANHLSPNTARLIGSTYFLLLGLINLTATFFYAELHALDLITATICVLPMLVKNRIFLSMFGLIAALISVYLLFGALAFSLEPNTLTSRFSFAMGFLFGGSALAASVLLIYSGKAEGKSEASVVI